MPSVRWRESVRRRGRARSRCAMCVRPLGVSKASLWSMTSYNVMAQQTPRLLLASVQRTPRQLVGLYQYLLTMLALNLIFQLFVFNCSVEIARLGIPPCVAAHPVWNTASTTQQLSNTSNKLGVSVHTQCAAARRAAQHRSASRANKPWDF